MTFVFISKRSGVGVALLCVWAASCVPREDGDNVQGPESPSDLTVIGSADSAAIFEGTPAALSATASRGHPPYLLRWNQDAGPEELELTGLTAATLATEPLTVAGRYVFRVVATDRQGFHATDFVAVEVLPAVVASASELIIVGDPSDLVATLDESFPDLELRWEVVRGEGTIADETVAVTTLTAAAGETLEVVLTVTLPSTGAEPVLTTREFEIVAVYDLTPRVLIETTLGDFTIELDGEAAPLHTANFLAYVDDGFFAGLLFHRVVCAEDEETGECEPFVIQGGGYERVGSELELKEPTRDAVPSEAENGLSNGELYSVSLAQSGSDPDSGTTQFFINLDEDNLSLDEQGFTVFGMVAEGTDVVDLIAAVETTDNPVIGFGETSLPVEDVIIERVSRE